MHPSLTDKGKHSHHERRNLENVIAEENCAYLIIDSSLLSFGQKRRKHHAISSSSKIRGLSPNFRGDQDLLKELIERHFFVKSKWRVKERLIEDLPGLNQKDIERRITTLTTRKETKS